MVLSFWIEAKRLSGNKVSFQTKGEGNGVFMVQKCQNAFDRFMKLLEFGTGMGNGIIVIPEGRIGGGWVGFVKLMREMVNFRNLVSVFENRVVLMNGGGERDSRNKKVISDSSSKGVNHHREVSYLSILTNPRQEGSGPQQIYGIGKFRKDELVLDGVKRNDVLWRK
ncbi:uncharacterized protein LOC121243380 [Juglans microcarpa x Juglans regia]|uniref:uncharacterized protein LOC121243380 n=1 Tax=Juglans microcarpa x Juglans regia TaxID=2249226 RepID=UPI001B7DF6B6|nr:uncharacterized protein LOC121243380 [Juglans microcarpa x Juglans regia]